MPNLSSKSLFHFTNREGFEGILSSNFRSSFSKERMSIAGSSQVWDYFAPMICFCDIPLSLLNEHINMYGPFGIGMTREWGIQNGLNPVMYYQNDSTLFNVFSEVMTYMHNGNVELKKLGMQLTDFHETYLKSRYLMQYYKPWMGYDNKYKEERIFYNEREWRYVPKSNDGIEAIYDSTGDFELRKTEYYNFLIKPILEFTPNDITFLIIEKEKDRSDVIDMIREKKSRFEYAEVEILVSKIVSVEQIEKDV